METTLSKSQIWVNPLIYVDISCPSQWGLPTEKRKLLPQVKLKWKSRMAQCNTHFVFYKKLKEEILYLYIHIFPCKYGLQECQNCLLLPNYYFILNTPLHYYKMEQYYSSCFPYCNIYFKALHKIEFGNLLLTDLKFNQMKSFLCSEEICI